MTRSSDPMKTSKPTAGLADPAPVAPPPQKGPTPPQVAVKIRCPLCRSESVVSCGSTDRVRYYRCRVCGDPESMEYTRFKTPISDPLRPPERVDPKEMIEDLNPPKRKG